jgi:serine/threonine protein kinase
MAASLDHPNVIPIFEAGESDGVLFIAMRYVEGTDLEKLLEAEGPSPWRGRRGSSPRWPRPWTPPTRPDSSTAT